MPRVAHHHIDYALIAESRIDFAGSGVQRDQIATRGKNDPRRILFVARPVRHAARRRTALGGRVAPHFFPRHRIERHHASRRGDIHDAIHHDRRSFRPSSAESRSRRVAPQRKRPGGLQRRDVLRVDLRQRRVARGGRIMVVGRPITRCRFDLLGRCQLRRTKQAARIRPESSFVKLLASVAHAITCPARRVCPPAAKAPAALFVM